MQLLENKKIVLFGGSGFLGLAMAEYLQSAGAKVTIVSRSTPKLTGQWNHQNLDLQRLRQAKCNFPAATVILDRSLEGAEVIHFTGKRYLLRGRASTANRNNEK